MIEEAGGLCGVPDLSARWGVSLARAAQLAHHPSFPEPVGIVGRRRARIYLAAEADAWRLSRAQ